MQLLIFLAVIHSHLHETLHSAMIKFYWRIIGRSWWRGQQNSSQRQSSRADNKIIYQDERRHKILAGARKGGQFFAKKGGHPIKLPLNTSETINFLRRRCAPHSGIQEDLEQAGLGAYKKEIRSPIKSGRGTKKEIDFAKSLATFEKPPIYVAKRSGARMSVSLWSATTEKFLEEYDAYSASMYYLKNVAFLRCEKVLCGRKHAPFMWSLWGI